MAATALSLVITSQAIDSDGLIKLSLSVLYSDPVLGISGEQPAFVKFPVTATVQQIENAIEDEIILQGQINYPTMTLPRGSIIMLDIKKGS